MTNNLVQYIVYLNKRNWIDPLLIIAFTIYSCGVKQDLNNNSDSIFIQVSSEHSGVKFNNKISENEEQNILRDPYYYNGGGVALGDINNDGLPDIYFTGNMVGDQLYLNNGNLHFEKITQKVGILSTNLWTTGVTFIDINNDGWLDIYVCRSGIRSFRNNLLYINQGNGKFVESAKKYGLNDNGYSIQASFFDFDLDGDLDMYLVNHSIKYFENQNDLFALKNNPDSNEADKLYQNNNDGSFTDISKKAGINHFGFGLSASIGDLNRDGWPDIYTANDFFEPDYFYINNGDGTFTNKLEESFGHISFSSMGSDISDINNDGLLDLMVCDMQPADNYRKKANMTIMDPLKFERLIKEGYHYQYMQNTLQLNSGAGRFSEIAELSGISETDWSWGPLFFDMDNDGWKDLFISNGIKRDIQYKDILVEMKKEGYNSAQTKSLDIINNFPVKKLKNYSYKNNDGITFQNQSDSWGINFKGFTTGAAYGDLDMDGDLDLVLNNIDDEASIYENRLSNNPQNVANYIQIVLQGIDGNIMAIGATVKVVVGNNSQYQVLQPTRGYQSAVEPIIHFGLNTAKKIDEVEVHWPNGTFTYLQNILTNQRIDIKQENTTSRRDNAQPPSPLFTEVTETISLNQYHQEKLYNDFIKEPLLPHKFSQLGPCIVVGDVNGDELDDFYIGGSGGYSGHLFIQDDTGFFITFSETTWDKDKRYEDVGSLFFDCDGDGDQDLYVASGSNEWDIGSEMYQDRLYINNGKGQFKRQFNALPESHISNSVVQAADYDEDGDLDLFIGGRLQPGRYPFPAGSTILRNDGGVFTDVTIEIAKTLQKIGMVTDAIWTDFDNDHDFDLMVVGEWMPITLLENINGKFSSYITPSLSKTNGWWNSLTQADIDMDGDMDYVVGNIGLNYKYKASKAEPFQVYAADFDNSSSMDIVFGYYNVGEVFPLKGWQGSIEQIPTLKNKFPTNSMFASSTLSKIYGEEALDKAFHLQAFSFASIFIENLGKGQFNISQLPVQAQVSSINGIIIDDFNEDGFPDILMAGNMYNSEVETARNDAGLGIVLIGNESNNYSVLPTSSSGFLASGDVKGLAKLKRQDGSTLILVANNNDKLQAFSIHKTEALKRD